MIDDPALSGDGGDGDEQAERDGGEVGEAQREEAEVDAVTDALLEENQDVDDVGDAAERADNGGDDDEDIVLDGGVLRGGEALNSLRRAGRSVIQPQS